jgi:hypothetical protein
MAVTIRRIPEEAGPATVCDAPLLDNRQVQNCLRTLQTAFEVAHAAAFDWGEQTPSRAARQAVEELIPPPLSPRPRGSSALAVVARYAFFPDGDVPTEDQANRDAVLAAQLAVYRAALQT